MSRQALSLALLCLVTLQLSITFSDASLPGLVAQPPSGARPAGGRGRPTVATVAEDDHLPVLTPKPPVPRAGSVAPSQHKAPEPTLCRRFADLDVFAQAVAHLKPDADKSVTEIKSAVERQFVVEGLEHIRGALSHVTQVTQSTYEHHYLPGMAAEAAKRAELEASPHYRPEGITEVHNLVPTLAAGIKEAKKFQCHASYEFFWAMLQGWQGAVKGMTTTRPKPVVALGKGVDVALKCLAHVILHEGCEPPKESQRIPEQFTATRTISNTELAQLRKQAYSHRF